MPQWNCHCPNCRDARAGWLASLTQSSVALSADGKAWFLVNASPDLRTQIEAFPGLHPQGPSLRQSPIEAVLLTNADLDHVLGLFLLREGNCLSIHATGAVRETLSKGLRLDALLGSFCGATWHEPPFDDHQPLKMRDGTKTGLSYRTIALAQTQPLYFREGAAKGAQSVAYEIRDDRTGGRLLIAPDVESLTPELTAALEKADAILFDGTFWSNDELQRVNGTARTALEMGHLPIETHSLKALRGLRARHRIFLHINNTNPILRPGSPERKEIEAANLTVGHDGLEFEL
ncbi:MAG: pyrroloquinoline quinone biosynthesis protein PqqB [Methylacidiphilales bacterium]|nr:pyrroloquinoline quinone biosynthesis protein PqqB [Candidatus Methylacidiphilales bacterium]